MLIITVGMARGTVMLRDSAARRRHWYGMCTLGSAGLMQFVLCSLRLSAGLLPSLHGRTLVQRHALGWFCG